MTRWLGPLTTLVLKLQCGTFATSTKKAGLLRAGELGFTAWREGWEIPVGLSGLGASPRGEVEQPCLRLELVAQRFGGRRHVLSYMVCKLVRGQKASGQVSNYLHPRIFLHCCIFLCVVSGPH